VDEAVPGTPVARRSGPDELGDSFGRKAAHPSSVPCAANLGLTFQTTAAAANVTGLPFSEQRDYMRRQDGHHSLL
jgi:hypothetical protein